LGISLSLAHLEGKVSTCLKEGGSVRRYSVSNIRGNSFKDMDIVCYEGRYRRSFHPTAGNLCVSIGVFFLRCGYWVFDPGREREN
jgi:hypothetical protein